MSEASQPPFDPDSMTLGPDAANIQAGQEQPLLNDDELLRAYQVRSELPELQRIEARLQADEQVRAARKAEHTQRGQELRTERQGILDQKMEAELATVKGEPTPERRNEHATKIYGKFQNDEDRKTFYGERTDKMIAARQQRDEKITAARRALHAVSKDSPGYQEASQEWQRATQAAKDEFEAATAEAENDYRAKADRIWDKYRDQSKADAQAEVDDEPAKAARRDYINRNGGPAAIDYIKRQEAAAKGYPEQKQPVAEPQEPQEPAVTVERPDSIPPQEWLGMTAVVRRQATEASAAAEAESEPEPESEPELAAEAVESDEFSTEHAAEVARTVLGEADDDDEAIEGELVDEADEEAPETETDDEIIELDGEEVDPLAVLDDSLDPDDFAASWAAAEAQRYGVTPESAPAAPVDAPEIIEEINEGRRLGRIMRSVSRGLRGLPGGIKGKALSTYRTAMANKAANEGRAKVDSERWTKDQKALWRNVPPGWKMACIAAGAFATAGASLPLVAIATGVSATAGKLMDSSMEKSGRQKLVGVWDNKVRGERQRLDKIQRAEARAAAMPPPEIIEDLEES